jgi:MFS family permease
LLLILPLLFIIFLFYHLIKEKRIAINRLVTSLLIIAIVFEFIAFITWLAYPFIGGRVYGDNKWVFARLESAVFYITGLSSPFIALLIFFSYVYTPLLKDFKISEKLKSYIEPITQLKSNNKFNIEKYYKHILITAIILSIVFAYYPYIPTINPDRVSVGVDVVGYVEWINDIINSNDLGKAFYFADGSRPLSLLFFLAVYKLLSFMLDLQTVIKSLPIILAPVLIYTIYRFSLILYNNDKFNAAIAALVSVFSYHVVIGIYAGFFANWFALIIMYITMALIVLYLRSKEKRYLIYALIALELVMLSHLYTWTYLIASLLIFELVASISNRRLDKHIMLLIVIIAVSIASDLARAYALSLPAGAERDLSIAKESIGYEQFLRRYYNLNYTFATYVGGYYTNIIMLLLVLLWVVNVRKDLDYMLLASFIYVGSLPILFGDYVVQTRVFYNIPFSIAASYIIVRILKLNDNDNNRRIAILLFSFIMLVMLNYILRALSNLVLIF